MTDYSATSARELALKLAMRNRNFVALDELSDAAAILRKYAEMVETEHSLREQIARLESLNDQAEADFRNLAQQSADTVIEQSAIIRAVAVAAEHIGGSATLPLTVANLKARLDRAIASTKENGS